MKLIYFKKTENTIEKYEVSFMEERVAYVREKLIDNCCIQKKIKINSMWGPNENYWTKNIKKGKKIGTKEYKDGIDEPLYEYTYDNYSPTPMVEALTNILNKNSIGLDAIQRKIYSASPTDIIDEQIEDLDAAINKIDNWDTERKISSLKKLQELLELRKINENKQSEEKYKKEIESLFEWHLLETLSQESLMSVCSFFDADYTISGLKRYLKK